MGLRLEWLFVDEVLELFMHGKGSKMAPCRPSAKLNPNRPDQGRRAAA